MIKVIAIDDEQHCINRVGSLLLPYKETVELSGTFSTVDEAIKGIDLIKPDVIFLDVQIHDQLGFDVLGGIKSMDFSLIFTTAYEQYAIQAIKFSALDYLLKPINKEEFTSSLNKAIQKTESKQVRQQVDLLLSNLPLREKPTKISIPTVDGYEFLDISDIIRCQSDINYTHIYTKSNKEYIASKTLKHFEGLLSDCNFYRVHNSHLVNLNYIKRYTKGKGGFLTLTDNSTVEVSSRRKDEFLKLIR